MTNTPTYKHQELITRLENENRFHHEQCARLNKSIADASNEILKHREAQDRIRAALTWLRQDK